MRDRSVRRTGEHNAAVLQWRQRFDHVVPRSPRTIGGFPDGCRMVRVNGHGNIHADGWRAYVNQRSLTIR